MRKAKVAVVIPSWNSAKDLPKLLGSLKKQRLETAEMVVILSDNASSDNSVVAAKKVLRSVVIVQNRENLGLAGGNNVGMNKALELGAELVIGINADTVVDRRLVESLVAAHRRHPRAILSPKIYFAAGREFHKDRYKASERGRVIWYAGGVMDWQNVLGSNRGVDEVDKGQYDREKQTDFATGCCFLISAELIKETGGFDEDLFLYYEDNDLSMKVKKAGGEVWYIPAARLWHVNAGSSGVGSKLHDYYTARNRLVLGLRWATLRTKFALIRESLKLLVVSRSGQREGVIDFYFGRLGPGSFRL